MRVALVYDRVNKWGGAERVLLSLHKLFPGAPLYTSVYNPKTAPWAVIFPKIITSFLQRFPLAKVRHDLCAMLMPIAFESFDFSEYDLVISVTSEYAKGVITKPPTRHICYCLTPTRYLWSGYKDYINTPLRKTLLKPAISYLRKWDRVASSRPDVMVGISQIVSKRISKYYGRQSSVVYPPINTGRFSTPLHKQSLSLRDRSVVNVKSGYYLIVSRLVPYKKVDLAIGLFNRLKRPLVIVGTGSEEKNLRRIAGKNIFFTGFVTDEDLINLYKECKALICPQEEDFGIVSVEAQAAGRPVIAYNKGGLAETVIAGKTGILFDTQSERSLERAIIKFETKNLLIKDCQQSAARFDEEKFLKSFAKLVS